MKKLIIAAAFILLAGIAFGQNWFPAGSHPQDYYMGGDPMVSQGAENSGYIKSKVSEIDGFGTWMTQIKADTYLGKEIRLSAFVKTKDVDTWVGLWMRVDGNETTLSFDNMEDRPITGTSDWRKYEIVLDVPEGSSSIYYGILLAGTGEAWVSGMQVELAARSEE